MQLGARELSELSRRRGRRLARAELIRNGSRGGVGLTSMEYLAPEATDSSRKGLLDRKEECDRANSPARLNLPGSTAASRCSHLGGPTQGADHTRILGIQA